MTLAIALITAGLSVLSVLFGAFFVGSILSLVVWVLLSNCLGKMWALVLGLSLYVVLLLALSQVLPSVNVTIVAGMFILAGMTNGAYQQIPWAMYPDLMDITRRDSGAAIEGAFSAVWLFGQKLANALAPAVLGVVLARAGWQETTEGFVVQSDGALAALHLCLTLAPAAILAVSIAGLLLIYRPMVVRALA